jgi:pyruvate/2-oxoglutarate dehydrogenase complex dihydrolipoamide acyltransferase (E2) component
MSEAEGATGVNVSWSVESGEAVLPSTLIAEVAVDKVDAEVYPETAGVITCSRRRTLRFAHGAVIAQVT